MPTNRIEGYFPSDDLGDGPEIRLLRDVFAQETLDKMLEEELQRMDDERKTSKLSEQQLRLKWCCKRVLFLYGLIEKYGHGGTDFILSQEYPIMVERIGLLLKE